jgi:hypothetical protein
MKIPTFSSEEEKAAWLFDHRAEIGAEIRERIKSLAERVAGDINERAAKMTPADRKRADAETKRIAERVRGCQLPQA